MATDVASFAFRFVEVWRDNQALTSQAKHVTIMEIERMACIPFFNGIGL